MTLPTGPEQNASEVAHIQARYAYEQFIRASRARARRERIRGKIKYAIIAAAIMAGLVAGFMFVEYAGAAPLEPKGPDSLFQRGLKEPDAAPQKGITIQDAKNACEKHGGHWFEESPEEFPQGKIIGCLFLVPRGSK
jgi:hypothetical protein